MSEKLHSEVTQFMRAVDAYKRWLDCGKDFVDHTFLFEIWDFEAREYMKETGMNKSEVINQIWKALGIK